MYEFNIVANEYLGQNTRGFYHTVYTRMGNPGNPDYINSLKNTYNSFSAHKLNTAAQELGNVLLEDFPQILRSYKLDSLMVCVVPRAKAEKNYQANQLLFKSTILKVVNRINGLIDGTNYISRHTNTRTTHLPDSTPNYNNDGKRPYPGITTDTCYISRNINGKDILLIDDLYTKSVNIDEDAIQALLYHGANSVALYAVGCRM